MTILPVLEWPLAMASGALRLWHVKTSGHAANFRYVRSPWSGRLYEILECECGRAWRL